MRGYVIHFVKISIHSKVSNVDKAFVERTVKPPEMLNERLNVIQWQNKPNKAQRPMSTKTHVLPMLPSERVANKIAPATYIEE
jgi:hypothetical protein